MLLLLILLCVPAFALAGSGSNDTQVETNVDLLFESFESVILPDGWHKIHLGASYSWGGTSSRSNTGNRSIYCKDGSPGSVQDEYLVTPALDFSYNIGPKVQWYEDQNDWQSRGGIHYVMVSTTSQTNPDAFEVVATMTPADHTIAGFGNDPVEVDLSAYAGMSPVYVALRYTGDDADDWYIDDLKVFELVGAGGDVSPTSVGPNNVSYNDGDTFTPTAAVYNNGSETVTFDVTMQILESGVEVFSESVTVTDLASDSTDNLSFSQFTVTEGHLIELRCTTFMDGDQIPANDTRSSYNTAYTQQHIPMGLLFTNAGCGPCVSANQTLDSYIPTQGNDVALARVHVSWPGSDAIYNANSAQANAMVADYGVSGVPAFFIDGVDGGYASNFIPAYTAAKQLKSPMSIELLFDDENDQLTVKVHVVEMMRPMPNLKLRAFVTEDNVYYPGTNGETHHSQAMRHIWPDTDGLDVPTTTGTHTYVIDTPLTTLWHYGELRATVYIQDMDSRVMLQAGTDFLSEIDDPIASAVGDEMVSAYHLSANYPNPFNPSTTISFNLPRDEQAEISVYAVDGSKVATLVSEVMTAGDHSVVWMGKDSKGASVASGAYFYRLTTPTYSETRVMTLIK